MVDIVFTVFVTLAWQLIREGIRVCTGKLRIQKPQALCAGCFYAHVQYRANAKLAISCTYGGAVRPMELDVLYCTDYSAPNLPIRNGAVKFVREIAPAE